MNQPVTKSKRLLSGNEAIALGAYLAGVTVASAYPGTPSTEILENIATYDGVYAEWSTNEKVAMEVATGAAYAGARALVSMKHVGLNVAADPFFAVAVTGIRGGLVIVSADDPAMHSSQNEQDNRHYARFAKVPLLEPADSQEAFELTQLAFEISERYDTPVMLRTTTRISHSKSVVETPAAGPDGRYARPVRPLPGLFERTPEKLVMIPAYARKRRLAMEERLASVAAFAETFAPNQIQPGSSRLGVITSGAAYQYARETFPDATFLKLALSYPLPVGLVRLLASRVERMIVVEELDPILEEAIRGLGIDVEGKRYFPNIGELSLEVVAAGARRASLLAQPETATEPTLVGDPVPLPVRPPQLCPGCPHTASFYAIKHMAPKQIAPKFLDAHRVAGEDGQPVRGARAVVAGDIGCYTLGVLPPMVTLDTTGCMGASIGNALGMEKAGLPQKAVSVIGDSTFLHSGIPALLDVVYNGGTTTTIILDNSTTAMTGHQEHPGTGVTAKGVRTKPANLEAIVRAVGVDDLQVVDAFKLPDVQSALARAIDYSGPSVVIVRGECVLKTRGTGAPALVDQTACNGCAACVRLGCPAIGFADGKAKIDSVLCVGARCGTCLDVCPRGAISIEASAS